MKTRHNILLTGITGAVGGWIAAEALSRGHRILAIIRGGDAADAMVRIGQAVGIAGVRNAADGVEAIKGDICEDSFGVTDETKLNGVSMIFHCAASIEFSDNNSEHNLKTNVEGTKNALDLAAKLKVPVCYISTAYIAGKRHGIVKENETGIGQAFNNVYEQTKCQAETLVHRWAKETGLAAFIFRPSIVIGDSKAGRIATFNGIYNTLAFLDTIGPAIRNEEIRVVGQADITKNLIPVDYLAQAIWHIIDIGPAGTYHITNPCPLTLEQLRDIYSNLFGFNARLVTEEEFHRRKPTRTELLYRKINLLYAPYMAGEPVFDRKNTDSVLKYTDLKMPAIDTAYFNRLVNYARSVRWGKSQPSRKVADGSSLAATEMYFEDFMTKKINHQIFPGLQNLSVSFRIALKERPDIYWSLAVKQGVLTDISRNGMTYDCSFIVDMDAFEQIASGKLSPQFAFFKRKVSFEGNTETGLKLVNALAIFFKNHPFNMETGGQ